MDLNVHVNPKQGNRMGVKHLSNSFTHPNQLPHTQVGQNLGSLENADVYVLSI
jgi:hypothetical protein